MAQDVVDVPWALFVLLGAIKFLVPCMALRSPALVVPLVVPCSTAAAAAVVSLSIFVVWLLFVVWARLYHRCPPCAFKQYIESKYYQLVYKKVKEKKRHTRDK